MHTNSQGQKLGVSVLFSTALDQPGLFLNNLGFGSNALKNLGTNMELAVESVVDLQGLINNSQRYISYSGSTSTPPCTPGTTWVIIADTIKASIL